MVKNDFYSISKSKDSKGGFLNIIKLCFAMTKPSNVIYTFFKDCLITNKLDTSYIVIAEESWLQG